MQTLAGFLLIVLGLIGFKWGIDWSKDKNGVFGIVIGLIGLLFGIGIFISGIYPVLALLK